MFKQDLDKVIAQARDAGVKKIITNGVNSETNRLCVEFASKYDIVEAALGWYPQSALAREVEAGDHPLAAQELALDEEIAWMKKQKFVALGEVGLDYKDGDAADGQKEDFLKMIYLAKELDLPLIVHSRKAEMDVVSMLEESGHKKIVLHCFSGKFKLVKRAAENGWSFSIPTNIVKSEHFQKLVAEVDMSQILTETDAPYLSPFVGKRNEPAFIAESVKKIAEIKGMDVKEVENIIFMNYQKIFM